MAHSHLQLAHRYLRFLYHARKNRAGLPKSILQLQQTLSSTSTLHNQALEEQRAKLLQDHRLIQRLDLGAGSSAHRVPQNEIKVSQLAKESLSSSAQCEILQNLIRHVQAKTVLEFGTSLGLSTAYLAQAAKQVWTMEGCPNTASIAQEQLERFENVHMLVGDFKEQLVQILRQVQRLDLVFIDGNHSYEPTLDYFRSLLPNLHADSLLVFDDIHWSGGMERAWSEIMAHPQVCTSVDIFWAGLVFFNPDLPQGHYTLQSRFSPFVR